MKYLNGLAEIPTFEERHDRSSKVFYGFLYRPQAWLANTVYLPGSYMIPTDFVGWYFEVVSPGKSGTVEPTLDISKDGALTKDGTKGLVWAARPYALLPMDQNILGSSWETDIAGVTLSSQTFTNYSTLVRVTSVPVNVDEVILTNTTLRGFEITDPETSFETIVRSIKLIIGDT